MEIETVVAELISNKYAAWIGGKLVFTNGFYRDVLVPPVDPFLEHKDAPATLKAQYIKYMEDAEIPFRVTTKDGSSYTVRAFSMSGMKAFQSCLREISYEDLVRCTKYYYKQTELMRMKIANYLEEEIWRGAFDELKKRGQSKPATGHISFNR